MSRRPYDQPPRNGRHCQWSRYRHCKQGMPGPDLLDSPGFTCNIPADDHPCGQGSSRAHAHVWRPNAAEFVWAERQDLYRPSGICISRAAFVSAGRHLYKPSCVAENLYRPSATPWRRGGRTRNGASVRGELSWQARLRARLVVHGSFASKAERERERVEESK